LCAGTTVQGGVGKKPGGGARTPWVQRGPLRSQKGGARGIFFTPGGWGPRGVGMLVGWGWGTRGVVWSVWRTPGGAGGGVAWLFFPRGGFFRVFPKKRGTGGGRADEGGEGRGGPPPQKGGGAHGGNPHIKRGGHPGGICLHTPGRGGPGGGTGTDPLPGGGRKSVGGEKQNPGPTFGAKAIFKATPGGGQPQAPRAPHQTQDFFGGGRGKKLGGARNG